MADTLYPYWGPPEVIHAEFPVEFVLKGCPPDLKAQMLLCMQWSKEDSDEWVSRNWKTEDNDELDGIEGIAPPPAVLLLANKYVPVQIRIRMRNVWWTICVTRRLVGIYSPINSLRQYGKSQRIISDSSTKTRSVAIPSSCVTY